MKLASELPLENSRNRTQFARLQALALFAPGPARTYRGRRPARTRSHGSRVPFKAIPFASSDPVASAPPFPQCSAAERLRARGDAAGVPRLRRRRRRGLRRARGVGRCGCRAGRTSAAARETGASTWGTFRPTCARRTWRTCSTSTAASARSSSRTGTASCPSPSCASRTPGEAPLRPPA